MKAPEQVVLPCPDAHWRPCQACGPEGGPCLHGPAHCEASGNVSANVHATVSGTVAGSGAPPPPQRHPGAGRCHRQRFQRRAGPLPAPPLHGGHDPGADDRSGEEGGHRGPRRRHFPHPRQDPIGHRQGGYADHQRRRVRTVYHIATTGSCWSRPRTVIDGIKILIKIFGRAATASIGH